MIAAVLLVYLLLIAVVARLTSRGEATDFYSAGRRSPWLMVAIGMVGASVSGVTFVSVPGMVLHGNMSYLQMCLGFIPGYLVVAYVLLPLYYKRGGASIYTLLHERLGQGAHRTGALFFILSDMVGTAVKFYLVCIILQQYVFAQWGVPFALTVPLLIMAIWLYTRRGGVKTLVYTDVLQTVCMIAALVMIVAATTQVLDLSGIQVFEAVACDSRSTIFVSDWASPNNFFKMFVAGAFTVIVMTGLNQNMMQKNLTCRTLHQAQKNMVLCGLLFTPVNALFLALGVLLCQLAAHDGVTLPQAGDQLLPMFIESGRLGQSALLLFTLGVASAAFSSADSSLTALTTTTLFDIIHRPDDERLRRRVHLALAALLIVLVYLLRVIGSGSLIDTVYTLVSYTYGPLLALFIMARRQRTPLRFVPTLVVCLLAPAATWLISSTVAAHGYHFGYELLLLNAAIAYIGLSCCHFSFHSFHDSPSAGEA